MSAHLFDAAGYACSCCGAADPSEPCEPPLSLAEWSPRRWRAGLLHVLQQHRDERWLAQHRGRDLRGCDGRCASCTLRRAEPGERAGAVVEEKGAAHDVGKA